MKRRKFLTNTLTVGAALAILPSGTGASTKSNSTLRLAQIGCGRMGRGDMTNAMGSGIREEFNARIVACCDVDANRTKSAGEMVEKFYRERGEEKVNVTLHGDYREIIARDDIDGVIISTPENWHAIMGVAAANAKKHMYVQKPLTYSIPEGRALVDAVRKNNIVLQTGSQQRSSIHFRQVCTIIRNGWLGKLQRIEVEVPTDSGRADGQPGPAPAHLDFDKWLGPCPEVPYIESMVHPDQGFGRPGWLQVEQYCLGMITGWGSHMYDIAQWGIGDDQFPVEFQATGEFPDRGHFNVHVGYQGEARYANGVVMTSKNGNPGVRFITEDGWAYCQRGKMECSDPQLLRRQPTDSEISLYNSGNHMGDFLSSVHQGKDPICPVEIGHNSNAICVLHHLSMKLGGRKLKWDAATERIIGDDEAHARLTIPMRAPYVL
ncbi:MAG: Gfo/Idh/MocA family protein [Luteolibacter sp.]|jgi:myo-inositol 2-dehydrogenase / D-chiro-inositol 1-dehydrogenase